MLNRYLRSRACQAGAVVIAFLAVGALHLENDGLWYPDAPLHAANGLFWWDFLNALPADPVEFAIRYYARYPIIKPAAYPPLFYLFEGVAFAAAGPSPYIAKSIVLLFAVMAGFYTMAWARRWISSLAGWAGAFLAFLPGIVVWSNAVMLNIPAMALGLASLYHFRRWLETTTTKDLVIAAAFFTALVLTYYPGAIVLAVFAAWALLFRRGLQVNRRLVWIAVGALVAFVPLAASLALGPVHTSRHVPSLAFLTATSTWTFYWTSLPEIVGIPALALAALGVAGGLSSARWRTEAACAATWITVVIVCVSAEPARDPRYILFVAPAFVLAAAVGIASAGRYLAAVDERWPAAALIATLGAGFWLAARVPVPRVTGFREVAAYLEQHAPKDAVLYDGSYGALFGFYVRASDPLFERRVAAANKLLYQFGAGETFAWTQTTHVASADEVIDVLRTRSGCRWVAIAVEPRPSWLHGRRLLQEAVARREFELVRSFPTSGAGGRRVDLYRIVDGVDSVATVDLQFPSFSNREFRHIVPITR